VAVPAIQKLNSEQLVHIDQDSAMGEWIEISFFRTRSRAIIA